MKRTIILGAAGAILLVAAVAALELGHPATSSTKIKITASFYPVAEFARQIGGDKVEVTTMVKPGVEPHDYDPTPGDLAGLYKSKLFVYNGAGLEKWTGRVQGDLKANHVAAVDASDGITLRQLAPGGQDTGTDPHVWLDPLLATREVTNIENALAQADPANAAYYHDHAAAYKQQLAGLASPSAAATTSSPRTRPLATSAAATASPSPPFPACRPTTNPRRKSWPRSPPTPRPTTSNTSSLRPSLTPNFPKPSPRKLALKPWSSTPSKASPAMKLPTATTTSPFNVPI
jgi:ABC-type Zn uptake system ZnuABC Zn-binding protein ZnuA